MALLELRPQGADTVLNAEHVFRSPSEEDRQLETHSRVNMPLLKREMEAEGLDVLIGVSQENFTYVMLVNECADPFALAREYPAKGTGLSLRDLNRHSEVSPVGLVGALQLIVFAAKPVWRLT